MKRSSHGEERHADSDRPTSQAFADKSKSVEIYLDVESGYYIFVGERGRTHIFTPEYLHHTSFRTTKNNRLERQTSGKWKRINREDLPEELK